MTILAFVGFGGESGRIVVRFGHRHRILVQTGPNLWVTFGVVCVCANDGCTRSIKVHESRWENLVLDKEFFKFEVWTSVWYVYWYGRTY